jgi:hypothetical protein
MVDSAGKAGDPDMGAFVVALDALAPGDRVVMVPLGNGDLGLRHPTDEDEGAIVYRLDATGQPGGFTLQLDLPAGDQ